MRCTFGALLLLTGSILLGQGPPLNQPAAVQPSEGVRPRSQANEYAAQAQNDRAVLAASVVPSEQVKQRFAYDISKTYVVVEAACYPTPQGPVRLSSDGFSIRLSTNPDSVFPVEASTVAAKIDKRDSPHSPSQSSPIYVGANVGYEQGTDPYTGRRVSNVYTGVGVGVGDSPVPPYPSAGGYGIDRGLLEEQLWHRSFPDGLCSNPKAGYLYFPTSLVKKEKGFYLLEVLGEAGYKWSLRIPLSHP